MTEARETKEKIEKIRQLLDSLEQQVHECKAILRGEAEIK